MLKLLTFKWILNELLLETEWSEVMLIWWFVSIKFVRSSFKILFFKCLYSNNSPCNFNFTGKAVHFPSIDIIMVALFCFFSVFFFRKYHLLIFFCQFFNKTVNPKCKIPFSKLLQVFIYYRFLVQGFQKI